MKERLESIYINGSKTVYIISDHGNVYNIMTGRKMRLATDKKGYNRICLTVNGKKHTKKVHRLVARAFVVKPVKSFLKNNTVNHRDGNKKNNHYSNLEWATNKEQNDHAISNGLWKPLKGSKNGQTKFKEEDIHEVCRLLRIGLSAPKIKLLTGVSVHVIYTIKNKKNWKHISDLYDRK